MTDAVYVDECADWARRLTQKEARGPGDIPEAWRRLEVRYGIPWGAFWSLRYRRPKTVRPSLYFRFLAAYRAECERQRERLVDEIENTRKIAGSDHPAVVAAEAVVGTQDK